MNEEIENALKCLEMDMLDNTQIELLLNYIDKLQKENKELKCGIINLKEKIHWALDGNAIARGYQIIIDNYFNEILGGENK